MCDSRVQLGLLAMVLVPLTACPGAEKPALPVDAGTLTADAAGPEHEGEIPVPDALPTLEAGTSGEVASPTPGEPLPETSFIFERRVVVGGRSVSQLFAFDLESGQERLISKLDHNGRSRELKGLALSPDRRSVAFTEWDYMPSTVDMRLGFVFGVISLMGVDGRGLRALTAPPVLPLNETGPSCAVTQRCPGIASCIAQRCAYENFIHEYLDPVFAPDGQWLFAGVYMGWFSLDPFNSGGGTTVSWPLAGGGSRSHGVLGCLLKSPVAFHPDGQTAVLGHDACGQTREGFHEFTVRPFAPARLLAAEPQLSSWSSTETLRWWPDGSALLFVAKNLSKQTGNDRRGGLYMWERATGTYKRLFEPATDELDIIDFTITPQQKVIVGTQIQGTERDRFFYRLQLLDIATSLLTPLPLSSPVLRPRA